MKTMIRLTVAMLVITGLHAPVALAAPLTYPVQVAEPWPVPDAPFPTAPSWVLYDVGAGVTIASRSADEVRAMASVTKIMTGLLVVELADFSDEVTVSATAAATGEKEIKLVAGETVTVEDLFKALMVHSANDAATALAEHIAGSLAGFVELMNERADAMGLLDTSFANPHGLDATNHYTTANDLLTMTREAMQHEEFAEAVRLQSFAFPPDPEGNPRIAQTTNLMLADYPGMIGVKTGFTNQALLTFVASAERDGRQVIVVVLGSDGQRAHFADARLLLDYAFSRMPYYAMLSSGKPYVSATPRVDPAPLSVSRDAEAYLHLAAQGVFMDPPSSISGSDTLEPPPIVETVIRPSAGPQSLWESLTYWFSASTQ
jgi:serine-type D-Ala-D-Ala carboxypeptidase (penicillin-binding protein 5/6)